MKNHPDKSNDKPNDLSSQEENNLFGVFFSRMEKIRKQKGLSSADIAREIGIANQSFQKYRDGRIPGSSYLLKISHALGVSMNWLLGDGDINQPAYLPETSAGSNISKEDLAAIKKALKHVSDANALLSNLISK